jgi:hypothetical protein
LTGACRFAYPQARIQARYADLPGEDDWQRLAGARTLGIFLEEAREGALRSWVKGFSALSDAHDLERGLRAIWTDSVEEVALWVPGPWHPACSWLRWLPLLPLFAHAARGHALPDWMSQDLALHPLRGADGALDPKALSAAGAGVLLVPPEGLADAWRAQWRRLWPACERRFLVNLERLAERVLRHAQSFAQSGRDGAWPLRRELRERLRLDFHRLELQPAAAFTFLALVALDLERLRAALMQRALFPTQEAL